MTVKYLSCRRVSGAAGRLCRGPRQRGVGAGHDPAAAPVPGRGGRGLDTGGQQGGRGQTPGGPRPRTIILMSHSTFVIRL